MFKIPGKDQMVSKLIRTAVIEPKILEYGKLIKFELNSKNKTIFLSVLPKGEEKPIDIEIGSYEVHDTPDGPQLKFTNVNTSREWITTLAREFLDRKSITPA